MAMGLFSGAGYRGASRTVVENFESLVESCLFDEPLDKILRAPNSSFSYPTLRKAYALIGKSVPKLHPLTMLALKFFLRSSPESVFTVAAKIRDIYDENKNFTAACAAEIVSGKPLDIRKRGT